MIVVFILSALLLSGEAAQRSNPTSKVGVAAKRSNPMSKEWWLHGHRRAERT